jgi:hypothetical protein
MESCRRLRCCVRDARHSQRIPPLSTCDGQDIVHAGQRPRPDIGQRERRHELDLTERAGEWGARAKVPHRRKAPQHALLGVEEGDPE